MLDWYEQKYPDVNGVMALKSLCYFDDIDFAATIVYMNKAMSWDLVKKRILDMVQEPERKFPGM
jgi:hypothetical protein